MKEKKEIPDYQQTTHRIDKELYKDFKIAVIKNNDTIQNVLETFINKYLRKE